MTRRTGIAAGILAANAVMVGALGGPAQAATLPSLSSFGVSGATWEEQSNAQLKNPGGLKALCVLGVSCETRLWTTQQAFAIESAGRAKSAKDATRRLRDIRSSDKAHFETVPASLIWSSVKPGKDKSLKGVSAWFGSALFPDYTLNVGMVQKANRIAYFVVTADHVVPKKSLTIPLAKLVKSKKKLSKLTGPIKGFYGTAQVYSNQQ